MAGAGVSDTMASALWALDALFYLDSQDVDGVNLHSYPGSSNGLFDFTHVNGTLGRDRPSAVLRSADVRPSRARGVTPAGGPEAAGCRNCEPGRRSGPTTRCGSC